MAEQVAEDRPVEMVESALQRGSTQPMAAMTRQGSSTLGAAQPSYQPVRWEFVNTGLSQIDELTHGKAGLLQRLVSYLVIGGTAAVVNLVVLAFMMDVVKWPANYNAHYILANVVAYEISILANFIPNDYFTFRHLPGHNRSYGARCLRFHITSISGVAVTFIISASLHYGLKLQYLIAQAIALILAVIYNFTVHHLFTYRHTAHV